MAISAFTLANGQVPNTKTSVFASATGNTTLVKSMTFFNSDTVDNTVTVFLKNDTGSSIVIARQILKPDATFHFLPRSPYVLGSDDEIELQCTSASVVDYWISGGDFTPPVSGVIATHIADGLIENPDDEIYPVPGSTTLYLTGITIFNTDSTGQNVTIVLNNGTTDRILFKVCVKPLDVFYFETSIALTAGMSIRGLGETHEVCSYWIDGALE